jgi:hypothetical protein
MSETVKHIILEDSVMRKMESLYTKQEQLYKDYEICNQKMLDSLWRIEEAIKEKTPLEFTRDWGSNIYVRELGDLVVVRKNPTRLLINTYILCAESQSNNSDQNPFIFHIRKSESYELGWMKSLRLKIMILIKRIFSR